MQGYTRLSGTGNRTSHPCCHKSQRQGQTIWERKEFPWGHVGSEDAAGWKTLLPTSTSPVQRQMSFPLLEGKVWDRQSSYIFFVLSSWEISRFVKQKRGNQYWLHEEGAEYVAEARCGLQQA